MKKYLLYTVLLSIFFSACEEKEDALTPSDADRNWLVVEDNPNDPVDHQRYLLYNKYDMPIFYNDTLGKSEVTRPNGGTYTHYEILSTFYMPSSLDGKMYGGHFSLCPPEDKSQLLPVLKMLETAVLPRVSKEMQITSILLVDTLLVSTTGIGQGSPATNYNGFNTWMIGNIFQIASMNEDERKTYGIDLLINWVKSNSKTLDSRFYAVSERFGAKYNESGSNRSFYSHGGADALMYGFPSIINVAEIYAGIRLEEGMNPPKKITDLDYLNLPEGLCLETFGLLNPLKDYPPQEGEPKHLWFTPKKGDDFNDYCRILFEYTPSEFKAKYGNYPVVMEKYDIVKKEFEAYGFTFE